MVEEGLTEQPRELPELLEATEHHGDVAGRNHDVAVADHHDVQAELTDFFRSLRQGGGRIAGDNGHIPVNDCSRGLLAHSRPHSGRKLLSAPSFREAVGYSLGRPMVNATPRDPCNLTKKEVEAAPMNLSQAELNHLVGLHRPLVEGARLRAVHAVADQPALVLECYRPGQTTLFLLSLAPRGARLHRIARRPPSPPAPPTFVMLLRARVVGGTIRRLSVAEDDRIVQWEIACGGISYDLVAELGGHANFFLLKEGLVEGTFHGRTSRDRPITVGSNYEAPEARREGGGAAFRDGFPRDEAADAFLEEWYADFDLREALDQRRTELLAGLTRARRKLSQRMVAIANDAERSHAAPTLRREADLLQTLRGQPVPALGRVAVQDWFEEGAPMTFIELDPRLDFAANIDARYARARKFERGEAHARARLAEAEQQQERLARLAAEATVANDLVTLAKLAAAARSAGLLPRKQAPPSVRQAEVRHPYRRFIASTGEEILVGRGGRDNDKLTFGIGRGTDLWLHVADHPGPHVILRTGGRQAGPVALREAAELAVWFSVAKHDTHVAVHHTLRKNVRRAKDAPPGRVYLSETKTVTVGPLTEEKLRPLLERLPPEPP